MALKSKKLKDTSKEAKDNARVTVGTRQTQNVLKDGVPCDHQGKHLTPSPMVGVSVGSTLNMDNYESLRVDVWLSDYVQEDETIEKAYQRVVKVVDKTLQDIVNQYTDD